MKITVAKCPCCRRKISLKTISLAERADEIERERMQNVRPIAFSFADEMRDIVRRHSTERKAA